MLLVVLWGGSFSIMLPIWVALYSECKFVTIVNMHMHSFPSENEHFKNEIEFNFVSAFGISLVKNIFGQSEFTSLKNGMNFETQNLISSGP